jgi:hypothetical protein
MNQINGGIPRPEHARLQLWTVNDRPSDYPSNYVARLSTIGADGAQMTQHLLVSSDLNAIRAQMMAWGLHCMTRRPDDDPVIVEVWL